jgi:3-methyl-2-oxobutanoate hydroxymethyltransferase
MSKTKISTLDLLERKSRGIKISVITAYDATFARLFDAAGVDVLLVGDSLGMVIQGLDNTLPVTLDEMIYHGRAVARIRPRAHVVVDLPFMSYQTSVQSAVESAGRVLKETGCGSIKLEGGESVAPHVRACVAAGIPVMGHLGLTPQSINVFGGFRVQGKTQTAQEQLVNDARALESAGAYAIVLEGLPAEVAAQVTGALRIPTIGIFAGPHCDGQVLVCYDLLGLQTEHRFKFVKRYADLGIAVTDAVTQYVDDVRNGQFPADEHAVSLRDTAKPEGS